MKPKPQYFKYVDYDIPESEAERARPIAISGLPTGGGGEGGAVETVNGQTGAVVLTAEDIEVQPGYSVYDGVMGLTQGAAHQADELHNLKLRVTALESALEGLEG